MKKSSAKKLVLTALFAALTMLATTFIRIPIPLGYVNLGDAFVLLSAFVLGPVWGTLAAGVGSAIADVIGYAVYAPATLIIKSLSALAAYYVYKAVGVATGKPIVGEIFAGVALSIIMPLGYFFYEIMFFETAAVAIVNLPYNVIQGVVATVIATLLTRVLKSLKLGEVL